MFAQAVARGDEFAREKNYDEALVIYKRALAIDCCENEKDSIREKIKAIQKLNE